MGYAGDFWPRLGLGTTGSPTSSSIQASNPASPSLNQSITRQTKKIPSRTASPRISGSGWCSTPPFPASRQRKDRVSRLAGMDGLILLSSSLPRRPRPAQLVTMLFFAALAWSSLAMSLASAASSNKYSSTSSSTPSSTSSSRATHTVKVGPRENPHQYVPHNVSAAVGDVVLFEFYPTNHSVVQADYMAPCVPARGDIFYSGPVNDFNLENGFIVGEVCLCPCLPRCVAGLTAYSPRPGQSSSTTPR